MMQVIYQFCWPFVALHAASQLLHGFACGLLAEGKGASAKVQLQACDDLYHLLHAGGPRSDRDLCPGSMVAFTNHGNLTILVRIGQETKW